MTEPGPWHPVEQWTELLRDMQTTGREGRQALRFWNGIEGQQPFDIGYHLKTFGKDWAAHMPEGWTAPATLVRVIDEPRTPPACAGMPEPAGE